jgi:hypothetical protein
LGSGGAPNSGGTGGDGTGGNGTGANGTGANGTGGNGTGGNGTGGNGTGGNGTGANGTGGNGTGGNGGSGPLRESYCARGEPQAVANTTGPIQLAFPLASSSNWRAAWRSASSIYVRAFSRSTVEAAGSAVELTGSASPAGIAMIASGEDEREAVSWNLDDTEWTIHDHLVLAPTFNPNTPSTGDLGGSNATITALTGVDDDTYLLAGVHDSEGIVALFQSGAYVGSTSLQEAGDTDTVYSVAPVWYGGEFNVMFVDAGGLQFTAVPANVSGADAKTTLVGPDPDTGGPSSYVRATDFGDELAVVWLEAGAVRVGLVAPGSNDIRTLDVTPSAFNNRYPNLAKSGARLAVSWLDANTNEIFIQRIESDFTIAEQPFRAAQNVVVEAYGFAGDPLGSSSELFAAAYNTTSLEIVVVNCPF